MVEIERHSALAGVHVVGTIGGALGAGVILAERRQLGMVHLAGNANCPVFSTGVKTATSCELPTDANSFSISRSDGRAVIWLAPTRWLCVSPGHRPGIPVDALRAACGESVAVVDVSHGRTVIRISGPKARETLLKGPPIDLHPSVFGPGSAVQSIMAHCGVLLTCVDEDTFDIYCFRAFGQHLWEWLVEASLEFGYQVADIVSD